MQGGATHTGLNLGYREEGGSKHSGNFQKKYHNGAMSPKRDLTPTLQIQG